MDMAGGGRQETQPCESRPHATRPPRFFSSLFAASLPNQAPIIASQGPREAGLLKVVSSCGRRRQHLTLARSVRCHQRHLPVRCP